jgi:hypothetical protein
LQQGTDETFTAGVLACIEGLEDPEFIRKEAA